MDYLGLAETALEKIAEFGQSATVRHVVSLGYDPGLTITVDATGKTYTRSAGSWIVDGFKAGDSIIFAGFSDAGNNGAKIASAVAALVLTCATASGLAAVTDAASVAATANQDAACDVLEQDVNSVSMFASSLAAGSLVSESTRFFLLAGATPLVNDRLVIGSAQYVIEAARPFSPGDTVIFWTVRTKA